MKILKRIRNKFHADLFTILDQIKNTILDKMDWLSLQLQGQTERVNREWLEQIARIDAELQNQSIIMKQQVMEITTQQEIIEKLLTDIQNQKLQMEKNNYVIERVNASVLSMLPYFPLIRSNGEEIIANVNSIYSFCLNEAVKRQTKVENTDVYSYYKKLHCLTACHKIIDDGVKKCRIGRQNDGGYVMIKPFSANKIAYSIGICDDVSWDKEIAGYGYKIYQYDHTIAKLPEDDEAFHWQKIGLTGLTESEELKRLDTIIRENGHENCEGMLLKMDIEGYEWDLLCTCDQEILNQFDQIIMEIHWLNNSCAFEKIIAGLERLMLTHAVVHMHGNNFRYAAFCGDLVTPDVMEITLIKRNLYSLEFENSGCLGKMDQVNRPNSQDIWIERW